MSGPSSAHSVEFHPEASSEVEAETWYLRGENPAAAERFEVTLTRTLALLGRHPEIGPVIQDFPARRLRIKRLLGFRLSLVYEVTREGIRIYALAHHSREPGYWAGRVGTLPTRNE